jgi:hypothetical protein
MPHTPEAGPHEIVASAEAVFPKGNQDLRTFSQRVSAQSFSATFQYLLVHNIAIYFATFRISLRQSGNA